jgi:hypothetical protein
LRDLVIGMGEVGRALAVVLDCEGRDLHQPSGSAETLHIAYPWSSSFIEDTRAYQEAYRGRVVVHSTVPVGTCDPQGWTHSPVRGRHPDLVDGLRTFTKMFGGVDAGRIHWPGDTKTYPQAATTEAAKLWELIQFGIQVKVCQEIYDWSESQGLDGDQVYREAAEVYNQGYEKLNPQFIRPLLEHVPGPIGGHCVAENAGLIDHWLGRWVNG